MSVEERGPSVSVIMGVFNGEDFLRESLESILQQSFCDFELIVINDGSTDRSLEILSEYKDQRLKIINNKKNLGLTCSLNIGIDNAVGKYIARQDADDRSCRSRLEMQVRYLNENEEVGLVGSWVGFIGDKGDWIKEWRTPISHEEIVAGLQVGSCFAHGAVMMRREVVKKVGGYDPYFRYSQDYDLWLRLIHETRMANIPMVLYELRRFNGTISRKYTEAQAFYALLARAINQTQGGRALLVTEPDPKVLLTESFPEFWRHNKHHAADACWKKVEEALRYEGPLGAARLISRAYRLYPQRWRLRWIGGLLLRLWVRGKS